MGQYKQDVWQAKREQAVHLRRLGYSYRQIAEALGTSKAWVSKWLRRFAVDGWEGLADRSRRPHRCPRQLPASVRKAVIQARSELEAEAARGEGLKFIGAPAIRTRLREQGVRPLPSLRSIERILRHAGLTRPKTPAQEKKRSYPRLHPTQPHTLVQVDIYPPYLQGGQAVACFNAIDVVSRYPHSRAFDRRHRSGLFPHPSPPKSGNGRSLPSGLRPACVGGHPVGRPGSGQRQGPTLSGRLPAASSSPTGGTVPLAGPSAGPTPDLGFLGLSPPGHRVLSAAAPVCRPGPFHPAGGSRWHRAGAEPAMAGSWRRHRTRGVGDLAPDARPRSSGHLRCRARCSNAAPPGPS